MILFLQPFSVNGAGGGSRILRALLQNAPTPWVSVCSAPSIPPTALPQNETHLPSRPSWGRIERSRFAAVAQLSGAAFAARFRKRLKAYCLEQNVWAIHAIAHTGSDFVPALQVSRELGLPYFLSVHDDIAYTDRTALDGLTGRKGMRTAWRQADHRFAISDEIGQEYCRRYGKADYTIVTDGVEVVAEKGITPVEKRLHIYFMGIFHLTYERNLRALLEGLAKLQAKGEKWEITLTCRCEYIRPEVIQGPVLVQVLPFVAEGQVADEMREADLLYLPLPFGQENESFVRYSLSTKMVSYIGSGVPILYHGPRDSAAAHLLDKHRAAVLVYELNPTEIAAAFSGLTAQELTGMTTRALKLARDHFMIEQQRARFWTPILSRLGNGKR